MYIVRLERRSDPKADPVIMWLVSTQPQRWGEREEAMKFETKGEAWRAAGSIRVLGAWSVEEA